MAMDPPNAAGGAAKPSYCADGELACSAAPWGLTRQVPPAMPGAKVAEARALVEGRSTPKASGMIATLML